MPGRVWLPGSRKACSFSSPTAGAWWPGRAQLCSALPCTPTQPAGLSPWPCTEPPLLGMGTIPMHTGSACGQQTLSKEI